MAVLMTITTSGYVSCQDDFYFRKWPVSPQGTIRAGQSVELECRVSTEDRISISWTLNGELLTNSSRRYQNAVTGDLIIRRADHRLDSGSFACTATNVSSGFSIASQPATLNIQCKSNTDVSNPNHRLAPQFKDNTERANMARGIFMTIVNLSTSPRPRPHFHDRVTLVARAPLRFYLHLFSLLAYG